MNAVAKPTKVQQKLIENGFYLAKVTMYRQDRLTGGVSDIIDTYTGLIKQTESGIIYKQRNDARVSNQNINRLTDILTVSQRLISVEKIEA